MKRIFPIFIMVVFIFSFSQPVDAYVRVKGYYKKNGTYVAPHIRSNPNGLKYDNYGYKPSQGLYNKTHGTRGAHWNTPTWSTDPEYYEGKALYEGKVFNVNNRPRGVSKRELERISAHNYASYSVKNRPKGMSKREFEKSFSGR